MFDHGWLTKSELLVCPGDWIIDFPSQTLALNPVTFNALMDEVIKRDHKDGDV